MHADTWKNHWLGFLWWGHHYKKFIPVHAGKLCFSAAQLQQEYYSSAVACVHFAHIACLRLLKTEFPRSLDGKRKAICMTCTLSSRCVFILFFLWSYLKGKVYNWRMNMLNDSKRGSHAEIVELTKDVLQLLWQEVNYNEDVCSAKNLADCQAFCT
jgi:hypothetical protein